MRYPPAQWVGANPSDYSTDPITHFRVVIHIEQGSEQGTAGWFNNPASQVSAHFGNPRALFARIQQFVDTDQMAYHCAQFNSTSIGIENEGMSGQQLTLGQRVRLRRLLVWIHKVHHTPLVFTNRPYVSGVCGHGVLPEGALSHPDCPGEPVLVQVNAMIHAMIQPWWRSIFGGRG
jgi:hypothetical protein